MKTIPLAEAVAMIPDGASLMIGGFMGVGTPERVIDEIVRQGKRDLSVIANDTAKPGTGIGKLVSAKLVRKGGREPHRSQPRDSAADDRRRNGGGARARRARSSSGSGREASASAGFSTPTGVGTIVEEGKRKIEVDGRDFLLEVPLKADFALIHAFLADYTGNLSYALQRAISIRWWRWPAQSSSPPPSMSSRSG